MTERRNFLKTGAAALALDLNAAAIPPALLREARALVRQGRLGRIVFCRVADERLLTALLFVLDQSRTACLAEVDGSASGMSVLGRSSTLSVTETACQLYEAGMDAKPAALE